MDLNDQQLLHEGKINEARLKANQLARERMSDDFTKNAANAYKKILTRYPVMERSDDAKARLIAMHQPIPRPTKAMLAQNKAEEASRGEQTMLAQAMGMVSRHPDTSVATKVGDPQLNDPEPLSGSEFVKRESEIAAGSKGGGHSVTVQTTGTDAPPENQPAPRSDTPAAENATDAKPASADANANGQTSDTNDPKPTSENADSKAVDPKAAADPNELQVNSDPKPDAAPSQVNDLGGSGNGGGDQAGTNGNHKASSSDQDLADDNAIASSKRKKKKGLNKIIPVPGK